MLEFVDPEPKTIVLKLVAVERCSYKDFDTQGVAPPHTCWHQKLHDNLLGSRSGPCEPTVEEVRTDILGDPLY